MSSRKGGTGTIPGSFVRAAADGPHLRDHCKLWSVYLACAVGILVTGAAGRGAEDPELKS
jgi:hypothetical protein